MDDEIWVIGSKNTHADQSFLWSEDIPNISDADTVIIDMTTLDKSILDQIKSKIENIRQELHDKLYSDGTVVYVLNPDKIMVDQGLNEPSVVNHDLLPIKIDIHKTSRGTKLHWDDKHPYSDYLKDVEYFEYYFEAHDGDVFIDDELSVTDNSDRMLSGKFFMDAFEDTDDEDTDDEDTDDEDTDDEDTDDEDTDDEDTDDEDIGNFIILPPMTNNHDESINKIISVVKKDAKEAPPIWTKSIEITGLSEIRKNITEHKSKKQQLEKKIKIAYEEEEKLFRYVGLLYAQGQELEEIVKESFIMLGFQEIQKHRNPNDEDWVIELNSNSEFELGIIEVKGRKHKTNQSDIVQCNKWVDDYLQMESPKKTKGIFVSNQFRLESYPESTNKKHSFEPNELYYAETRNICIIPTYVLFEAVNKILNGVTPDRTKIEELIVNTNEIIYDLLQLET